MREAGSTVVPRLVGLPVGNVTARRAPVEAGAGGVQLPHPELSLSCIPGVSYLSCLTIGDKDSETGPYEVNSIFKNP